MLKFEQKNFSTYYPQGNVKVEFLNKILKNVGQTQDQMEQLSLFCPLGLQTLTKTTTSFTPFDLVYSVELVLPIEYQIP